MGHDLKQFKSLEGFLESGPSFCLQTYILMVGHKKGTNIDWDNVKEDDIERLLLLSCSILFSFLSLVKTSCSVNVPDPDPRRTKPQYKKSAKYFVLTLVLFNLTCILYRVIGISFFCVYLRQYIILIIVTGFLCNLCTWLYMSRSPTISIILGAISIFVPNGYLLYNFAGTLVVDLSRRGTKVVFFVSTIGPNIIWAGGIVGVAIYTGTSGLTLEHIISDHDTHLKFVIGMNIVLGILGLLSTMLGIVHWYCRDLHHAFRAEYGNTHRPVDVILCSGLNDVIAVLIVMKLCRIYMISAKPLEASALARTAHTGAVLQQQPYPSHPS
ncbi:uncharacterized protein LOC111700468 isoform X2 [Eurytemora carolleeae]|uniref:uncharacterized protein LOC111700468 isoform X2 n=1 Tax=Eurytemora carolleeae TaxID=1294199 RepID=UPI000C759D63|nr:uncharacterized protein LOC111700468 isoform X2 [Eurytemora carolleeae]|eukprot:XP_023327150.1 uncharacterized protein LOC111700468 isoform X2 [Eurytemora affinis]